VSASEKLRTLMKREAIIVVVSLDPTPLHVAGEPAPASVTLRNALPLIADCIALAEDVAETDKPLWGTSDGVGFKLQNALAALNEALS
jgi:hypothetical protein